MAFLSQQGRLSVGVNWCNAVEASGVIQIYPQHTPNQKSASVLEVLSYQLKEITSPHCIH